MASSEEAGRKRAAVELIASHGPVLRQTARRYSLCAADAEDAYQRGLEILLVKAPSDRARDLLGWTKTVVKHEALAIRRGRERLLGAAPPSGREDEGADPIAAIPAGGDGPPELLERRDDIARSREALRLLKPAELRALTLLAEGYSYAEIGQITGFSRTKVNRCLAEGRERFRAVLASSEDGSRCTEMGRLLSAFCDGETDREQSARVREHLRACPSCRATVRAYRAAPAAVAALAPALPLSRSLLERAQELVLGIQSRLPGGGGAADASLAGMAAAGGGKGAGMAALAKLLAVCAGTVGGAAACVATGVAPSPADLARDRTATPSVERVAEAVAEPTAPVAGEEAPPATRAEPERDRPPQEAPKRPGPASVPAETGAVEYVEAEATAPAAPPDPAPPPAPPPAPAPAPAPAPSGEAQGGSAAGEFGP